MALVGHEIGPKNDADGTPLISTYYVVLHDSELRQFWQSLQFQSRTKELQGLQCLHLHTRGRQENTHPLTRPVMSVFLCHFPSICFSKTRSWFSKSPASCTVCSSFERCSRVSDEYLFHSRVQTSSGTLNLCFISFTMSPGTNQNYHLDLNMFNIIIFEYIQG